jgi:hypothetical protein
VAWLEATLQVSQTNIQIIAAAPEPLGRVSRTLGEERWRLGWGMAA